MASTHGVAHALKRMSGRDPAESHRAATPLELLFDLVFVIAFGLAADEFAHALADDHIGTGLLAFGFAMFAVTWAWINYAWFASAYDTDDWVYRLTTMVQMVGVVVLALGLADLFESIEEGVSVDNQVVIAGYVVMRVAMMAQWGRALAQDPSRRDTCLTMIATLGVAQIGWVALGIAGLTVGPMFAFAGLLILVELAGPVLAEGRGGGTPWHAHHIAERYGLLVIITLGEGFIGTVAALEVLVGPEGTGWTSDVVVLAAAGTILTFGLWWSYFALPSADRLHAHRERSFGWGYGHIPLYATLVAVGAGLHVAAYLLEGEAEISEGTVLMTVAAPVGVFVVVLYLLYLQLTRSLDLFHAGLILGSAVVILASLLLVASGLDLVYGLLILSFTPWVTVVGFEVVGHRRMALSTGGTSAPSPARSPGR